MPFTNWQEFSRQPHIQRLPLHEQKRQFVFENQMQQQRDMHLYHMINGPAGGYNAPNSSYSTRSLLFDGIDDFVSCGSGASLQFTNIFSVSCWVKTSTNALMGIIAQRQGNTPTQEAFSLTSLGQIRMHNIVRLTANTSIIDGNWHHIAFTYNTSLASDNLKIYIDGSLDNSTNQTFTMANTGANSLYIGEFRSGFFFDGNIDEVAVWNTELSASDMTAIYNSGVPNDLSSLSPVSWWRMGDGDTASTLTDNGSGDNDGTINGATIVEDVPG